MKDEYIRIDNGIKFSEGYEKLYGIYLQILKGETYGIISGSMEDISTLVNILLGRDHFTRGEVYYKGKSVNQDSGKISWCNKMAVIDKQSHLVKNLSIAENIYIVKTDLNHSFISKKSLDKQIVELFEYFKLKISPESPVKYLDNLERCQIELLKAYVAGVECVLLDHRFNYFIGDELAELYVLVELLKQRGMTFIMVDYVISQVMQFADSLMVLCEGKTTAILGRPDFSEDSIRLWLTGKKDDSLTIPSIIHKQKKELALEIRGLTGIYLKDMNFSMRKGEIATIICEERSSADELCELLRGRARSIKGEIYVGKNKYKAKGYHRALRQGICFIENNPAGNNLFFNMNVYDNICIAKGSLLKRLWNNRRYRENMKQWITSLYGRDINEEPLYNLSEEELHKVVFYRAMLYHPQVIICINPFSTVDIHMSGITEDIIREFAKQGCAVLILAQNEQVSGHISSAVHRLTPSPKSNKTDPP